MTTTENRDLNSLSSSEKQNLKFVMSELLNAYRRKNSEQEMIKEILNQASEQFQIRKSIFRNAARFALKGNGKDTLSEVENAFQLMNETKA